MCLPKVDDGLISCFIVLCQLILDGTNLETSETTLRKRGNERLGRRKERVDECEDGPGGSV